MYSFRIILTAGERALTSLLGANRTGMAKRKPMIVAERFNLRVTIMKSRFEVI